MDKRQKILALAFGITVIIAIISFWMISNSKPTLAPVITPTPKPKTIPKETPKAPEVAPPITESTTDALTGTITKISKDSISINVNEKESTYPLSAKTQFIEIDPKKGITSKTQEDATVGTKVTVSFYAISKEATTVVIGQ
jgi:hypothetical protein